MKPHSTVPSSLLQAAALAASVVLGASAASAEPPAKEPAKAPANGWEKISERDGITVFRREVPGSPILAFRGEGTIDAPILRVASVLMDNSRAPEWVDSLAETRILRSVSDFERVVYHRIKTPAVLTDRDFVTLAKLKFTPEQKKVVLRSHSVEEPDSPKTDYVRGRIQKSEFTLTMIENGKKTRVATEVEIDPKGNLPTWVANMFQKQWPYNTITRLRAQSAKPDIKDNERIKTELTAKGFYK